MRLATTYNAINGFGPLGQPPTNNYIALTRVENVVSMFIGFITVIGGIWFTFQIFMGAFQWITAGGDKDAVQKAQKRFTNALIGLIILIFAYTLIALIGTTLGLNIFQLAATLNRIAN